jgi:hypothetical protein
VASCIAQALKVKVTTAKLLRGAKAIGLAVAVYDLAHKAHPKDVKMWRKALDEGETPVVVEWMDAARMRPCTDRIPLYRPATTDEGQPCARRAVSTWFDAGRGLGSTFKYYAPTGKRLARWRKNNPLRRVYPAHVHGAPRNYTVFDEMTLLEAFNAREVKVELQDRNHYMSHFVKSWSKYQGGMCAPIECVCDTQPAPTIDCPLPLC